MKDANKTDWKYIFLGASAGIAGPAYFGTALANVTTRLLVAQGATQEQAYAYLVSPSINLFGALVLAYSAIFAFVCGRVATMRIGRNSMLAGLLAGLIALTFQGVMAIGGYTEQRQAWQIYIGAFIPVVGSLVGALSRGGARA